LLVLSTIISVESVSGKETFNLAFSLLNLIRVNPKATNETKKKLLVLNTG
jgi:hypothetical protein